MAPLALEDRAGLAAEARAALQAQLAPLRTLEQVARWAFAQRPALDIAEVLVQDEFTHDVVVPLTQPEGHCLVFDVT
ncbi:hypothetical protein FGE12_19420 [Aggregicoccus sp. 17bor-14]|uniref:hypothetical protein n=1 Tax=Myxococcaceae TaxID=31 RepID=UPI0012F42BED|nr:MULTISPECIES: hypothetical protein [Myxococcaceae]MBF5044578.1 hypothetical protein [Simulacricoccus sp. 17bor-14]MRI90323.1 hypothetical protein [Aggregicoccus sp. 17bor-14]